MTVCARAEQPAGPGSPLPAHVPWQTNPRRPCSSAGFRGVRETRWGTEACGFSVFLALLMSHCHSHDPTAPTPPSWVTLLSPGPLSAQCCYCPGPVSRRPHLAASLLPMLEWRHVLHTPSPLLPPALAPPRAWAPWQRIYGTRNSLTLAPDGHNPPPEGRAWLHPLRLPSPSAWVSPAPWGAGGCKALSRAGERAGRGRGRRQLCRG